MNFAITLKKGLLGFVTGLTATVVFGIIQALSNYNPVICTKEIVENCTPQFISTGYYAILPVVTGSLVALANFLKNYGKS